MRGFLVNVVIELQATFMLAMNQITGTAIVLQPFEISQPLYETKYSCNSMKLILNFSEVMRLVLLL